MSSISEIDIRFQVLEEMLEHHDWQYEFSDDNRYYNRGRDQRRAFEKEIKELSTLGFEKECEELYKKYKR